MKDDPEASLAELLGSGLHVHVEMLEEEAGDDAQKREQLGIELAQIDAMDVLALVARRQPNALTDPERIARLLRDGLTEAAKFVDWSPEHIEFATAYATELGKAGARIMRAIESHLEAEQRPRS